jgi:hypothetical protein
MNKAEDNKFCCDERGKIGGDNQRIRQAMFMNNYSRRLQVVLRTRMQIIGLLRIRKKITYSARDKINYRLC